MNSAIIVAAGSGTRFGSTTPKQFLELSGKPLIIHTLERFQSCDAIHEIVLVLSPSEIEGFAETVSAFGIGKVRSIVPGGATRAGSVKCGFDVIDPATEIVAVHDGARPLVTPDEISRTVAMAADVGAACLVAPVADTIKEVDGGVITRTIDRSRLRRALTPQAFRYDILKRALNENDLDENATDECYLVEKLGIRIAVVDGSPRNIKITTPDDLLLAEALMRTDV